MPNVETVIIEDLKLSIREALQGSFICEYPTFNVLLQ